MTTFGQVLLAIAAFAAAAAIGGLVWGYFLGEREGEGITNAGYMSTFVVFGATTLAVVLLITAFFRKDFSFLYVAENHSTDVSSLAWLYNLSGLWAGREGSLLLWAWILSAFAAWMAYKRMAITDALSNIGLAVTNFVQVFFLVALFIETNNPFKAAIVAADGTVSNAAGQAVGQISQMAMNPLLQHWAMILHPPTLFVGYAGLAIAFAFAVAAVIVGDSSDRWIRMVDRVTVFSWLFLGIGIGLGAIWAYVVLGWGGFWGWDPVENASLLPWLTGVGLIHSFTAYRRKGAFKKWTVMMAAFTFFLVILGTFITRSGVIESVHSFGLDPISTWWFGGMMAIVLVVPALLLIVRGTAFAGTDEFDSLVSKNGSYYFNNVLMLLGALIVGGLTVAPAFGAPSSGPATYDLLARPVGIIYVALMAVCPILSWGRTEPGTFWNRAKWPLGAAAVVGAGLIAIWATVLLPNYQVNPNALTGLRSVQSGVDHTEAVIGLLVGALAVCLPIYLFIDGARKRAAARGTAFFTALGQIFVKARTQSGGYLAHLGIGIILIGLIGSTMYVKDVQFTLPEKDGAKYSIGGYDFIFRGFSQKDLPNGDQIAKANIDVTRGGTLVKKMTPGMSLFANRPENQSRRLDASVDSELLKDVFLVFQGTQEGGALSFNVKINPLISWAWVGFAILIVGSGLAMWPKRELEPVPATTPKKKRAA